MLSEFYTRLKELYTVSSISGLLDWDQQVCMPQNGAAYRADQRAYMSRKYYDLLADPRFVEIVRSLSSQDLSPADAVNVREMKRRVERNLKLPAEFVERQSRICSLSFSAWSDARPRDDWNGVRAHLETIVDSAREEASYIGGSDNPYDALLDNYEPATPLSVVKPLLSSLADELRKSVPALAQKMSSVPQLNGKFPEAIQIELNKRVAAEMGYDFRSGRLDTSAHPFESEIGPCDIRITTRFDISNYLSSLFSVMHETGHALYDSGTLREHAGTPMGWAVSMGIHESQSRLWENIVGRSRAFASYLTRTIKDYFPCQPGTGSTAEIWGLLNKVEQSLIRVESDEVTYSLHIVIRMLLEDALINKELTVKELPGAWNDLYEKYLGIRPPNFRDGVMQDSHWYGGAFGYFPSYALGNLYGAMFYTKAEKDIPNLSSLIEQGNFSKLREWLRRNVHEHGMRYRATELVKVVTGRELSVKPFITYLNEKFSG